MPNALSPLDRLRIERVVWALDQQLCDLPRRSRIATRQEVRSNLVAAAEDVGTTAALRGIGSSRRLAASYLTAELGDGPRHSWIAAAYAAGLIPMALMYVLSEAASAYQQGVTAGDPHATGTFVWSGVSLLQSPVTFTFDQGVANQVGGAWIWTTYLLWLAATVACGRLWRLLPRRKARRQAVAPAE